MVGIYKITNMLNHKVYIGQSWDIERRIHAHKTSNRKYHLYEAFKKYGLQNFSFDILYVFDDSVQQKDLDSMEEGYIRVFISHNNKYGYNSTLGGQNSRKSVATREKMSKALIGNTRNLGKKYSQETKDKISAALKGRSFEDLYGDKAAAMKENLSKKATGRKLSQEAKDNISKGCKGIPKSEETKRRMSLARKEYLANKENVNE